MILTHSYLIPTYILLVVYILNIGIFQEVLYQIPEDWGLKTNIECGINLFFPDKNENILKISTVPLPLDGKLLRKRTPGTETSPGISQRKVNIMIVGVEEALNEWDPQWMHAAGIDIAISRTILTDPLLYGRSSLQCGSKAWQILPLGHVHMLITSVENVHHSFFSLPPLDIYGLRFAFPTETVPIKISQTFLDQLYIISPPSFSICM